LSVCCTEPHVAPGSNLSSSDGCNPSSWPKLAPAIPCRSPYSPAVDPITLSICISLFAYCFIITFFSAHKSSCIVVNASTIACMCCLNLAPVKY
jgi:hypothetical protein